MPTLRIAAAQSPSVPGDIAANIQIHRQFIHAAHAAEVDVLVFPELSLSGYELPLLAGCALQIHAAVLDPLRELAQSSGITVVAGAPIRNGTLAPRIGAITFSPSGDTAVYYKQFLHQGEEQFASNGTVPCGPYAIGEESYALAICADTSHEQHATTAAATGASLYLAGVLISEAGYAKDSAQLQHYAASYDFGVLLANHAVPSGGYATAGRSAFWAPGGEQVIAAPGVGSFLVVAVRDAQGWRGELHTVQA